MMRTAVIPAACTTEYLIPWHALGKCIYLPQQQQRLSQPHYVLVDGEILNSAYFLYRDAIDSHVAWSGACCVRLKRPPIGL